MTILLESEIGDMILDMFINSSTLQGKGGLSNNYFYVLYRTHRLQRKLINK